MEENCRLADAIEAANTDAVTGGCPAGHGADVIALSADITLDAPLPQIKTVIRVEGAGFTISGNDKYRIFFIDGGNLTLNELTLTKGFTDWGGAINNERGSVSISNSAFSDNSAVAGGAIYNSGELSISNSVFTDNSARTDGGAIFNQRELSIIKSTFNNNSASNAGDKGSGGAIYHAFFSAELSIESSAFTDNWARLNGGAIYSGGEIAIKNSVFTDNRARENGGGLHLGHSANTLTHLTVVHNAAFVRGGGIYVPPLGANRAVNLRNSIVALNDPVDCHGKLNQDIGNLIQDGSCFSKQGGSPALDSIVIPEDGSPAYYPLMVGSPAIDAAHPAYCSETDQIGTKRPQGGACDIGAIEYVLFK